MLLNQIRDKDGKLSTAFYNKALRGQDGQKYTYEFNDRGQPTRIVAPFSFEEKVIESDRTLVTMTADINEIDMVLDHVNRKRRKQGLQCLSKDELVRDMTIIDEPAPPMTIRFSIDFAQLSIAMYKIAFELASMWLGTGFLADPSCAKARSAIVAASNRQYTNEYAQYISVVRSSNDAYDPFEEYQHHNIAFVNKTDTSVFAYVRILNTFVGKFPISARPGDYPDYEPLIVWNNAKERFHDVESLDVSRNRAYTKSMSELTDR